MFEDKGKQSFLTTEGSLGFFALVSDVVLSLVYQEQNVFQTHTGLNSTHKFPLMNTQQRDVCALRQRSLHLFFSVFQMQRPGVRDILQVCDIQQQAQNSKPKDDIFFVNTAAVLYFWQI